MEIKHALEKPIPKLKLVSTNRKKKPTILQVMAQDPRLPL